MRVELIECEKHTGGWLCNREVGREEALEESDSSLDLMFSERGCEGGVEGREGGDLREMEEALVGKDDGSICKRDSVNGKRVGRVGRRKLWRRLVS